MKRILLLTACWLLGTPALSTAADFRIAHDQRFPPFAEVKDGQSTGLAVDLLRAAAGKAGITVVFVPVPFDQLPRTLEDGRADATFPTAITPDRREKFDFSAPLLPTGGAFFVRSPAPTPDTLASVAGKTITTPRTGPLVAYLQKNAPDAKLIVTADYDESLAQLVSGQADVAALNFQTGAKLATRLHPGKITPPDRLFWELPFAVAVPKGQSADLLARLNGGIAAIHADGTFEKINRNWMAQ